MLASNLFGRHRPAGEQISGMWYSHNYPWDKPAYPPGQTDPSLAKKKLNNKQETEEHATEGVGCSEHTGEDGKGKMLISVRTFIKQRLEK
jgi:hypothetical protein